jgi:hypothetical protein
VHLELAPVRLGQLRERRLVAGARSRHDSALTSQRHRHYDGNEAGNSSLVEGLIAQGLHRL